MQTYYATVITVKFQSTYLYKVRHSISSKCFIRLKFQSTYLYKVRPFFRIIFSCHNSFNPRTYIRYDRTSFYYTYIQSCFNPRTYIRYDGTVFCVLFLFYQFKQCCYYLLGSVFSDPDKYKLWKTSYNAIMGIWGVSLYVPVLWLVFVGTYVTIPIVMFCILYILCRFVIIYKTIRIFHKKSTGLLYISLYLCGQEILPLVFLYEGIIYLYNFIETSTLWH